MGSGGRGGDDNKHKNDSRGKTFELSSSSNNGMIWTRKMESMEERCCSKRRESVWMRVQE
jgi:hypothetical protein